MMNSEDENRTFLAYTFLKYLALGIFLLWLSYSAFPTISLWLTIITGGGR